MDLLVDTLGGFISKYQGRLRVSKEKKVLQEVPLLHLEQVIVCGRGVSISSDAVRACAEQGIPIHFLSTSGVPVAGLYSAGLTGTVLTRRAQLRACEDGRGVTLAKAFVSGKLHNQANLLRYIARYRKEHDPACGEVLLAVSEGMVDSLHALKEVQGATVEPVRERLLGIEGGYAARYWGALARVVPAELGWPGRETRGAKDPFNQALNYGYGVLYRQVEYALVLAGLDPYAGMLHADRPGKPSLVLDLIEEFRQAVVDRTIIGQVNRGWQIGQMENGLLDEATRERIVERVLERLKSSEAYEGRRQPLRHILQSQARHIATFVRGDRGDYLPFVMGW